MSKKKKKKKKKKQKKNKFLFGNIINKNKEKHRRYFETEGYNKNHMNIYYCETCEQFMAHPSYKGHEWKKCPKCRTMAGFSFVKQAYIKI